MRVLANGLQLSVLELLLVPLILLGFGALVGLVGSLLAVRRFALRRLNRLRSFALKGSPCLTSKLGHSYLELQHSSSQLHPSTLKVQHPSFRLQSCSFELRHSSSKLQNFSPEVKRLSSKLQHPSFELEFKCSNIYSLSSHCLEAAHQIPPPPAPPWQGGLTL